MAGSGQPGGTISVASQLYLHARPRKEGLLEARGLTGDPCAPHSPGPPLEVAAPEEQLSRVSWDPWCMGLGVYPGGPNTGPQTGGLNTTDLYSLTVWRPDV